MYQQQYAASALGLCRLKQSLTLCLMCQVTHVGDSGYFGQASVFAFTSALASTRNM